jgi:hypothetical protein
MLVRNHGFDFVVVGGGMAGLSAAISAARHGARVAIIQDRPVFGGNASSEIRVRPVGASRNLTWARETGLIEELMLEDLATNHAQSNSHWDIILQNAVKREKNITSFLNTSVRAVQMEYTASGGSSIKSLEAVQLGTETEFRFTARQFADCTGDATVGFLAGADYRYGREARFEHHEPLAPVKADTATLSATIQIHARDIGRPVAFHAPPWVKTYRKPSDFGPGRKLPDIYRRSFTGWWWLAVGYPFDQVHDTQLVRDELLGHALGIWDYLKNHAPNKEDAANFALDWVGTVPGKRESRRLLGDVILTENDCHEDKLWPDRVAYAGWDIDLHVKGGIANKVDPPERGFADDNYRYWVTVAPFTLPLRCFYSRNVENLWMAGRNLSVTHVGLGPTRVQSTTASHGQAMGCAAAYAVKHGLRPRQVAEPDGPHISRVQQLLLLDDVRIPGLRNQDPGDLAPTAKVTADSEAPLSFGAAVTARGRIENRDDFVTGPTAPAADRTRHPIEKPLAQVFPVTHDRVEYVEVYLINPKPSGAVVSVQLHELNRIWDQGVGRLVASRELSLPGYTADWIRVPLNARTRPGRPHRLSVSGTATVEWAEGSHFPTGTSAQFRHTSNGGCEPRNRNLPSFAPEELALPAYAHWICQNRISRAVRVHPAPMPYVAASVTNGVAWPIDMPNLWISDPSASLPQSIYLQFETAQRFDTVIVSFDSDLNPLLSERPPFWRAADDRTADGRRSARTGRRAQPGTAGSACPALG